MSQDKYTDGQLFNLISGNSITGESTFDIWKSLNPEGTAEDFLNYLKGEGSGGVSSWNDLEDKPFDTTLDNTVIFESNGDDDDWSGWTGMPDGPLRFIFNNKIELENGKEYIVTLDDNTYRAICENLILNIDNYITINTTYIDDNSYNDFQYIKIETIAEEIITLDEKYIPQSIQRVKSGAIIPFPIYKKEVKSTYIIYDINLEELQPNKYYSFQEEVPNGITIFSRIDVVCEDESLKTVVGVDKSNIFIRSSTSKKGIITCHFLGKNGSYSVNISDKSTSNNVIVNTNIISQWLPVQNTEEYIPTSDYHPATKKYVDDISLSLRKLPIVFVDESTNYEYVSIINDSKVEFVCACASIEVTEYNDGYEDGENFYTEDMIVSAICQDGSKRDITQLVIKQNDLNNRVMVEGETEVNIYYTENGKQFSTIIEVDVKPDGSLIMPE